MQRTNIGSDCKEQRLKYSQYLLCPFVHAQVVDICGKKDNLLPQNMLTCGVLFWLQLYANIGIIQNITRLWISRLLFPFENDTSALMRYSTRSVLQKPSANQTL